MKLKTLLLIGGFFLPFVINAQGLCPPNVISTNPDNPYNFQNPNVVNNFDWLNPDYSSYLREDFVNDPILGFSPVSPFWTDRENLSWLSGFGTDGTGIDYLPKEGWELITYRLGKTNAGLEDSGFYAPYFLLYNKYRSIFRLFFNLPTIDGASVNTRVITKMAFNRKEVGDAVTGLFENIDGLSNPLDQKTGNYVMGAYSNPVEGGWNVVEFPLAYDPCTCSQGSTIITSFRSVLDQNHFDDTNRLLSVFSDGVSPEIGTETYKNIDAWIEKYVAAANNANPSEMDIVLQGLSNLLSALSPVTGFVGVIGSISDIKNNNPVLYQGINFITKSSEYLSVQLKSPSSGGKSGVYPQIAGMEMPLSGAISAINEIQSATFTFDNPGTSPSNNDFQFGNLEHPAYPFYNEVLGTFGLLKTPRIKRKADLSYTTVGQIGYYEDRYTVQFDLSSLEYVFNPILDINFDKTDIYASYVVETTADLASSPDDMELLSINNGIKRYVSKDLLPIECLHGVTPIFKTQGNALEKVVEKAKAGNFIGKEVFNVYLRITIDYEFFSLDENGHPIRTMQVFTYPVEMMDTYDVSPLPCGARTSVSQINLESYCSDGRYKANVAKAGKEGESPQEEVATINLYLNLYPNPTSGKLTVEFTLPEEASMNVLSGEMRVFNTLGQQVMNSGSFEVTSGFRKEIDVSQLPAGNYFIQFVTDNFNITKQFARDSR